MQAAMEYGYAKGCEGRMALDAVRNSHCFFYKLGMRTASLREDEEIKNLTVSNDDFGSYSGLNLH